MSIKKRQAMSINAPSDWWKTLFDDVYLLTDARSVCDDDITRREIDVVCGLLPIKKNSAILDMCGGHGRHSLELSSRGLGPCTLVDYSRPLLDHAQDQALKQGFAIKCHQSDARKIELEPESFDHVLIMGNSLGYIQTPGADVKILGEALRLLKPGGNILVDISDVSLSEKSINPNAWHEIGDDVVTCREREIKGNVIHVRELVLSKKNGLIRDQTYAIRYYNSQSLLRLLDESGFADTTVHTDFTPHQKSGDYGCMNKRMIGIGHKI